MKQSTMRGGNYAAELQEPLVYKQRRKRLAEKIGEGTIVVWGNGDDRGYGDVGTFRQGSDFFYLTGIELPNAAVVLRPEEGFEALFLPPRDTALERWTGPKWGPGEQAAEALGFDQVLSTSPGEVVLDARRRPVPGFEGRLQGWLSGPGSTLWTPYPAVPLSAELPPTHRLVSALRDRLPSFAVHDLSGALTEMRMVKDGGEIALMRQAVAATIAGQRAAARAIRPGAREAAVAGAVECAFAAAGAEGLAFPSIIGNGYSGTVLHYDQNVGLCEDGEVVVVDVGARFGYYCGDITRTYPVNGVFSERQRAIYELVLEAHDRAAEAIRPGVTIFELRKIAYGVFQDSALRDSADQRLGQHFIHGLGHFLGLDAHDPGADEIKLEPGMIITNEPGLYLQDECLGVRIENDFLVTADGCENLSAELVAGSEEIEALMKD